MLGLCTIYWKTQLFAAKNPLCFNCYLDICLPPHHKKLANACWLYVSIKHISLIPNVQNICFHPWQRAVYCSKWSTRQLVLLGAHAAECSSPLWWSYLFTSILSIMSHGQSCNWCSSCSTNHPANYRDMHLFGKSNISFPMHYREVPTFRQRYKCRQPRKDFLKVSLIPGSFAN